MAVSICPTVFAVLTVFTCHPKHLFKLTNTIAKCTVGCTLVLKQLILFIESFH